MEAEFQHNGHRATVVDAVEQSLRPLMPLFLNYNVTFSDLSEMLARLYVSAIQEKLAAEGRPTTTARLALTTGINRSRVEKVLADRDAAVNRQGVANRSTSALAAVLATWHNDPQFSTPYGVPLDLDLRQSDGRRTFADLVAAASPDIDADAALDQLVAAGCVEVHEMGFIRCTNRVYIPAGLDKARIARLGECMAALAATFTHNLLTEEGGPSYFERQVETDFSVSEAGRLIIKEHLDIEGQAFLTAFDEWLTSQQGQLESGSGKRFGVSMFVYDVADDLSRECARQRSAC